jgi:hypothetical protein
VLWASLARKIDDRVMEPALKLVRTQCSTAHKMAGLYLHHLKDYDLLRPTSGSDLVHQCLEFAAANVRINPVGQACSLTRNPKDCACEQYSREDVVMDFVTEFVKELWVWTAQAGLCLDCLKSSNLSKEGGTCRQQHGHFICPR